jgi:hypothetical protein
MRYESTLCFPYGVASYRRAPVTVQLSQQVNFPNCTGSVANSTFATNAANVLCSPSTCRRKLFVYIERERALCAPMQAGRVMRQKSLPWYHERAEACVPVSDGPQRYRTVGERLNNCGRSLRKGPSSNSSGTSRAVTAHYQMEWVLAVELSVLALRSLRLFLLWFVRLLHPRFARYFFPLHAGPTRFRVTIAPGPLRDRSVGLLQIPAPGF